MKTFIKQHTKKLLSWKLISLIFALTLATPSSASLIFNYSGDITLCTQTCDAFASLALDSKLSGMIEIDVSASSAFSDADIGAFSFQVFNPALPTIGPVGDAINDNPLLLSSALGVIASNGSAGITGVNSGLFGGQLILELLVPPLSSNSTFIVFDLATGTGQVCLFYATAGCLPGATQAAVFSGTFSLVQTPDPVPEPSGLMLVALSLIGMSLKMRKKR